MNDNEIIVINDLVKTYDNHTIALNHCNLSIHKGDMISIQGVSGCGKSSLLNILGLLDIQTSGDYYLFGKNINSYNEKQRAMLRNSSIGFVLQDFQLIEDLTVMMNIMLPLTFYRGKKDKHSKSIKIDHILENLGIQDKRKTIVRKLSGGQRQRVAIARAIVNDPQIILADEPTGNLDSTNTIEIMNLLKELNKAGKTIIVVTHNENVTKFCSKKYVMNDGKLTIDQNDK